MPLCGDVPERREAAQTFGSDGTCVARRMFFIGIAGLLMVVDQVTIADGVAFAVGTNGGVGPLQVCSQRSALLQGNLVRSEVEDTLCKMSRFKKPANCRHARNPLSSNCWAGRLTRTKKISIVAVPPQQVPPSGNRAALAQKLEAFLNRRAEKTRDISEQEIDAAVDEAVGHVRPSRG